MSPHVLGGEKEPVTPAQNPSCPSGGWKPLLPAVFGFPVSAGRDPREDGRGGCGAGVTGSEVGSWSEDSEAFGKGGLSFNHHLWGPVLSVWVCLRHHP